MGSKVIAVLGGTGTGKSKLAIELAKTYNGEVVNCDSMQVCFSATLSI
jgi:tRNA dimethylallyltransferase